MTKTTLAVAVTLAFSQLTHANTLGTVVVTDNSLPMASDSRTAESFRLTAKQEGGEILRNTLGVDASRMGGHGLDPTIRGQSQTQLNVILDDAYLHGGCPNRMDPPTSFANIESYDSVRIIQGVETLQYGTGGTGGTILFERGIPEMGTHGKVEVGAGDNAYKSSANAEVSTRGELGYIRAFAINKDGSNYKDGNGNTVRASYSTEPVRASYSTEHHGVIAGLTPKAGERIEMSAEKIVTHNALFQGSSMDAPYDEMNIMRLKYRSSNGFGFVDGVKADLSYAADEHLMDNYSLRPNMAMRMKSPTTSNTLSGKLALTSKLSSSTSVEYGLNIQNVNRKAELVRVMPLPQTNMSFNWPNVSTDRIGVFAEALHKLTNESRVKAGVRVDKVTAEADLLNAKANPMAITPAQMYDRVYGYKGDGKANEDHWSALARYELDLAKDLTWFTGVSRTMRTADETERFFANGASVNATGSFNTPGSAWVGNPNLNPEKHVQIDTGLSKQTEHYGWRATVFYDAVQDYILRDQRMVTNGKITTYRNVNATLYGAQVEGYTGFAWNTQLAGGLNYVNSHNDSDNRNIAQTPPLSGYVALNKQAGDLGLGARFRFQDKQSAIDTLSGLDTQKTPAWSVLDLYGSYRINKTVKVMAGVDNVFDHAYFQHVGRTDSLTGNTINLYEPGRSAWVKLSAKF
ncbi:MAG: hypothetical protein B7Z05_07810 [Thiotrichales bacterium 32-46-8]|nr:MAG: hypothetical protein B7Z05_07810 [Thiotrichales bacterium 32-46-8]